MPFLVAIAKLLAVTFGQRLAERLAAEFAGFAAKGCPEAIDKIANDAKACSAGRAKGKKNPPAGGNTGTA